jgi:hypothetical protein
MVLGGITVDTSHGLQSVTNTSNVTTNTVEFSNTTTAFVTTANVEVGGELTVSGNVEVGGELTVSGNVEVGGELTMTGTGALTVPNGTTGDRPAAATGMIRYNSTTGFMEGYAAAGWAPIAQPPTITGISPLTTLPSGGMVPNSWTGEVKHVSPNPDNTAYFGHSIAMNSDGTKFVVGADYEDFGGKGDVGGAYVFTYSGGSWDTGERLVVGDPESSDHFGHSVAMSSDGTKVIVGAHREDTGGSDNGAVYIFTYDSSSSSWGTGSKLQANSVNTGSADNQFGYSVAMNSNGTKIIVGARYEDSDAGATVNTNAGNSGAAFIYTYDGSNWGSEVRLKASDAQGTDYFGTSVAMNSDGTTVIVGAPDEDTGYATSGAAYIYTYNGSTWSQQQKIQATSTTASGDKRFGQSVDVSGDGKKFIVGAYWEDTSGGDAGSAYIYTYDDSSWGNLSSSEAHLANPSLASPGSDQFGWSVAMSSDGTKVIVGAKYAMSDPTQSGAAYIYTYSNSSWGTGVEITASDKAASDYFGSSVAMNSDGSRVIIGTPRQQAGGSERGAAYFYQFNKITDSGFIFDTSTQVFTATGTGIVSGSTVQLEGADGSLYSVVDATPPNAAGTQVTFKMGSEVVEFPPSAMSTNTSITGYTASASPGSNSGDAWKAFNDVVSTSSIDYWNASSGTYSTTAPYLPQGTGSAAPATTQDISGSLHIGHWIQLQIPNPVILTRAVIGSTTSGYQHGQFVILGSNNPSGNSRHGSGWTALHAGSGLDLSTNVTTLSAGSTEAFKYFRVVIKSVTSTTSGGHLELNNVQFFGRSGSWVLANQPYKVKVNSTSGLTGTSTTAIGFAVGWTSPAVNANLDFETGVSMTQTLVGTDGGGGTNRTFSLAPGSNALPSGLTLTGSTGAITGTIAANQDGVTTSVTFRLTDNNSGLFTDRAINIVGVNALYAFTSHSFTSYISSASDGLAGKKDGPTFAEMKTTYTSEIWEQNPLWFNSITQGYQIWTIPISGTYRIRARGARGGQCAPGFTYSANLFGRGAEVQADIYFTRNTKIVIIAGRTGEDPRDVSGNSNYGNTGGGGGGASWVLKDMGSGNYTTSDASEVYMVAGGGAGARGSDMSDYNGGQSVMDGNGTQQGTLGGGGSSSNSWGVGGGAGWTSAGSGNSGGQHPANGAQGGLYGSSGSYSQYRANGGFGGGGGNGIGDGGGGAGASGGQAGNGVSTTPGGGTSYIMPNNTYGFTVTNRTFSGVHTSGTMDGSVHIELV